MGEETALALKAEIKKLREEIGELRSEVTLLRSIMRGTVTAIKDDRDADAA